MVSYKQLKVDDPLAFVFDQLKLYKISYIISISAVVATTSVLLVFILGQPRIWMSMSRDGLLPKKFATVHPRFQTPSFATIITGLCSGVPALFVSSGTMTDLTSIGTLFAFVLVCFGVLALPRLAPTGTRSMFKMPYINGKWIVPALVAVILFFLRERIQLAIVNLGNENYPEVLFLIFIVLAIIAAMLSFQKNYSLIPILGGLCCLYLMTEIPAISWCWFFAWMALGLTIYFLYGRSRSKLA
jgi:amino acid transporter